MMIEYRGEIAWIQGENGKRLLTQRVRIEHPPGNYSFKFVPLRTYQREEMLASGEYSPSPIGSNLEEEDDFA